MKIRIENNSIRVRLTKPEVERFHKEYKIESITVFGPLPNQSLRCTLIKDDKIASIQSSFESQTISIRIAGKLVTKWAETELVGLEDNIGITKDTLLHIAIEKDFKRISNLHRKDQDAYPHPLERPD